jgi:hypothetical protein
MHRLARCAVTGAPDCGTNLRGATEGPWD